MTFRRSVRRDVRAGPYWAPRSRASDSPARTQALLLRRLVTLREFVADVVPPVDRLAVEDRTRNADLELAALGDARRESWWFAWNFDSVNWSAPRRHQFPPCVITGPPAAARRCASIRCGTSCEAVHALVSCRLISTPGEPNVRVHAARAVRGHASTTAGATSLGLRSGLVRDLARVRSGHPRSLRDCRLDGLQGAER